MSYVPVEGLKACRRCGELKDVVKFRVFRRHGDPNREYRRSWCRDCDREYGRQWRARNPGYHAAWSKRYRRL